MSKAVEPLRTEANAQKTDRIAVRLPTNVKRKLEYAAGVTGRSVSDFVVTSALEAAQECISRYERFRLTEEDRAVFFSALARPPVPNKALRAAARKYRTRTGG